MSTGQEPLDRLVAFEDLRLLQARLCRYIGIRAWDEFERLFTANGQLRAYGVDGELTCFADSPLIGRSIEARAPHGTLVVHAFGEELALLSGTRAEGIWAVEDFLFVERGRPVHGLGHLHQRYERQEGRWLIRSIDFTRRYVGRR